VTGASTVPGADAGFAPNGIVTLLTDFGTRDPFVGAMKGRILGACPQARIVDLTHEVTAYRPAEAGFWLERLRLDFPAGTVHLAIVDPGVGTARRLLAVRLDGQALLAPDNGLLGNLATLPGADVRAVSPQVLASLNPRPSFTFHGRDLFAPLAGRLAAGRLKFEDLGNKAQDPAPSGVPKARRSGRRIQGEVILIDRFGNLFSNIGDIPGNFLGLESTRFGGIDLPRVRTYGEASPGSCVALVNAFGVLEAACVEGSAADELGLGPGDRVEVVLPEGPAA
jgi:S-adenosylmethionine hydrolase